MLLINKSMMIKLLIILLMGVILLGTIIISCLYKSKNNYTPLNLTELASKRIQGKYLGCLKQYINRNSKPIIYDDNNSKPIIYNGSQLMVCTNMSTNDIAISFNMPGKLVSYYTRDEYYEADEQSNQNQEGFFVMFIRETPDKKNKLALFNLKNYSSEEEIVYSNILQLFDVDTEANRIIGVYTKNATETFILCQSEYFNGLYIYNKIGKLMHFLEFDKPTYIHSGFENGVLYGYDGSKLMVYELELGKLSIVQSVELGRNGDVHKCIFFNNDMLDSRVNIGYFGFYDGDYSYWYDYRTTKSIIKETNKLKNVTNGIAIKLISADDGLYYFRYRFDKEKNNIITQQILNQKYELLKYVGMSLQGAQYIIGSKINNKYHCYILDERNPFGTPLCIYEMQPIEENIEDVDVEDFFNNIYIFTKHRVLSLDMSRTQTIKNMMNNGKPIPLKTYSK